LKNLQKYLIFIWISCFYPDFDSTKFDERLRLERKFDGDFLIEIATFGNLYQPKVIVLAYGKRLSFYLGYSLLGINEFI
jgi:hypothetical protein